MLHTEQCFRHSSPFQPVVCKLAGVAVLASNKQKVEVQMCAVLHA